MKKFLLWLFIAWLSFIGFSNSYYLGDFPTRETITWEQSTETKYFSWWICFNYAYNKISNRDFYDLEWNIILNHSDMPDIARLICFNDPVWVKPITYYTTLYAFSNDNWLLFFTWWANNVNCPSTWEILSWYIEQWQLTSCQNSLTACQNANSWYNNTLNSCSNNLNTCEINLSNCLQGNPINSGDIMWSSLFINNIQHPWAWLINITIPEEIERDYSNIDDEFDLEITGYWYDQEKMQSIVNTQYYKPTSEEMSNLVWKVADFLPLIWVALLITRAWRILKKVF